MPIAEICSRGVVIANPDDSLRTVAALMRVHHVGSVVVTRDDAGLCRPLGIITDRDIVLALVAKDVSPDAVSAGDVMSEPLETIRETDEVWTALERMRSRGVRRLPVLGAQGELVGIVSADDLLELVAEELSGLARIIGREQRQEVSRRSD
ncbi:CBS domain-containing protein [Immundisolibacter sp.]|uniref:CBS domain-containing protein n=1 Tax=Immundisolibacter sp. TaxID=1934948 RepID=UPI00199A755F|nr:CBS domain-containing protein [Immundisolibacter sp.]MBC7161261.1 CBS domain-containing protein [Immundisolibacter sp.]MEA3220695.1 Hypoxic response protein 1 [Immundisolibacter sp.]